MAVPIQAEAIDANERGQVQANEGAEQQQDLVYLEPDGEPYTIESLCMSCYENVRCCPS